MIRRVAAWGVAVVAERRDVAVVFEDAQRTQSAA